MNERITELIKQCETLDGDGDGYFTRFDKEKFAELIIRECAKVSMDTSRDPYDQILKHFGVE